MNKVKFKKGDEVIVIAGREKGKTGRIEKIDSKKQTVIIKDLNMVTKHNKPSQMNTEGSISNIEAPIHVSNVAYLVKKLVKIQTLNFQKLDSK